MQLESFRPPEEISLDVADATLPRAAQRSPPVDDFRGVPVYISDVARRPNCFSHRPGTSRYLVEKPVREAIVLDLAQRPSKG
eukprot:6309047-Pyramimonas_sp.AAC.1